MKFVVSALLGLMVAATSLNGFAAVDEGQERPVAAKVPRKKTARPSKGRTHGAGHAKRGEKHKHEGSPTESKPERTGPMVAASLHTKAPSKPAALPSLPAAKSHPKAKTRAKGAKSHTSTHHATKSEEKDVDPAAEESGGETTF